jgi:ribosomal protein L7/L12
MGIFGDSGVSRDDFLALQTRVADLEKQVARLVMMANGGDSGAATFGGGAFTAAAAFAQTNSGGVADWQQEARALKAQGQLIQAIKVVRAATNAGLAEAKSYVEGL